MAKMYRVEEVAAIVGTEGTVIFKYIKNEWICPAEPESTLLDEEDVARARLIFELIEDFEVNDQAVPIILHLLDQIHGLHKEIKNLK